MREHSAQEMPHGGAHFVRFRAGKRVAGFIPETEVDMPARTGPFRSRLGHEGDGQAIGHGDLLRSMFEQDGAIGRFERIGVVDVDFVLGDRRFTFGELDRDPGGAQFGA